jgi:CheY-like chemotaxis protein
MEASGILSRRHRIIALTANVSSDAAAACREAGMDNFLPKPLRLSGMFLCLFF